ncbi:PEGA domain-containing protein [Candidatus Saccharibacteria bacterium]|nr:PEGA domain-containing protein [Candidatus Saccharibacteria bacterium]
MYRERKKKWRTIKLVITEIIMVVAVIATVVLLTFFAMGYRVDKDGELGQQGLFQIQSHPTGAVVTIDGEDLLAHTNTTKLLSAGEHTITLTKDGYDSWTKTFTSELGRLIKIVYPRLFLQDRTPETIREYEHPISFFVPATNRDAVLYSVDNSNRWVLLDVRGDDAIEKEIDLSEQLEGLAVADVVWDEDSDKVLVKAMRGDSPEWLLVNISDPESTISLNKEFDMDFLAAWFISDNGEKLMVLQNGANLRTIDLSNKTISGVLAKNVVMATQYNDKVFYLNNKNEVKILQENSDDIIVSTFDEGQKINILASGYVDSNYLTITVDDKMYIYLGDYPDSNHKLDDMKLILEKSIGFVPDTLSVEGLDELIMARAGRKIAVFDAEPDKFSTFEVASDQIFFVDSYMIGTIADGKLIVSDFDGTNVRTLTSATGTAFITKNNKWMYYLFSDNGKTIINREQIVD